MNIKSLIFTVIIFLLSFPICNGQPAFNDTLEVDAYSSFNSDSLPRILEVSTLHNKYDSLINSAFNFIGLKNPDVLIFKSRKFGASTVINRKNLKASFVYSPEYFDSVYNKTKSIFPIKCICYHEICHFIRFHPIKPTKYPQLYENEADWYSGYQMCLNQATLEQSLAAVLYFGNDSATRTHPEKKRRLLEVEKGYIDAKINFFKDTSYLPKQMIIRTDELLFALNSIKNPKENNESEYYVSDQFFIEDQILNESQLASYSEKVIKKSNNKEEKLENIILKSFKNNKHKEIYILYGELIYIKNNKVNLVSNGENIGIVEHEKNLNQSVLNLEGVRFLLDGNGNIFSFIETGDKFLIGKKIL